MDWLIFGFLLADGLTNGAIYAMLALALVLVFAVTRVILIPMGELVMYAPLTYAFFLDGKLPGTVWLAALMLAGWAALEYRTPRQAVLLALAAAAVLGIGVLGAHSTPLIAWIAAVLVVLPLGPATYRLFFEPIPRGTILVYLILAVGLHFVYRGLGLFFFGPEQFRPPAITSGEVVIGSVPIPYQALWIYAFTALLMAGLYLFFTQSLYGKALRAAAVNRIGARLSGISPKEAGRVAFLIAMSAGALTGMLTAPLTNAAYDMGFLMGLKGFVAAILGGLTSYPLAAGGALLVGLLEAYSSFAASAYKEAIVFALLLPVLVWRSLGTLELGGEEE
ncbi:branched-chain amino acid ABC transporter permease [Marinithermus hydrothermalis]|uniref:ABC-type transporter, integral membrane subunit n=1 Tax=Marinithermus hydrothermalis (strain DSM 14884 / JCM 11576 / T1) TaxID=869210 RepID=F2NK38_MARHT|nr:branched-chain amino acid ABC transporter permease [Marinithermus hydrothermalis]AEB12009.1 ABC-type transporter, integral membrane subunit [Marinithermus hydrothermalis DSM 14884]